MTTRRIHKYANEGRGPMRLSRDHMQGSSEVWLQVFKGSVVVLLFVLPATILSIQNSEFTLGFAVFGPPGVAITTVYILGIRRKLASLIAGTLISVTAVLSWVWFLVALTGQNLALGGPFGGYVFCLLLTVIVSITDAILIARGRRRASDR